MISNLKSRHSKVSPVLGMCSSSCKTKPATVSKSWSSWFIQSGAGTVVYNNEQLEHGEATVDWLSYLSTPDFWNRTLQNWQSEFLAVSTMVAFSIYLRQRGSAESKPVGTPHHETSTENE